MRVFLDGHLITKVGARFFIADTKFQPIGELGALNNLEEINSVKVSIDGSAAYLISKIKDPAGLTARNSTYLLGRFGDDGKLLWRTPVGNPPEILYEDGNTVLLKENEGLIWRVNGYSAKDGKLLYKIDIDKRRPDGGYHDIAGGRPEGGYDIAGRSGTTYYIYDAVPAAPKDPISRGKFAFSYQGYDIKTGKKVGGALKDNPLRRRNGSGDLANDMQVVGIFSNGDSLTAHDLRYSDEQDPPYSVQRVGKITWSVGSAKLPANYVSGNQNRVLVKGQSEKELVALDSLTGKAVGDPIPIADKSHLCGMSVPALLPDKLAALQCNEPSTEAAAIGGYLDFGYIISLP